jgi:hypothetical protein
MLSDPRIGLGVSLAIAALAAMWLAAQFIIGDELAGAIGMGRHAITFVAIFALASALAAALMFAQFNRVRMDLLAGRKVLAEWTVDPAAFTRAATAAERKDHTEKRGALILILVFTAVIFAGFAAFDPEAAPGMLGGGMAFSVVIIMAFLYGTRVRRIQMLFRSDRIVVGRGGLMVNGILHVWAVPLTWLVGAELADRPPATLSVTYAVLGRFGPNLQTVVLPVPEQALALAQRAALGLNATRRGKRQPPA